MYGPGTAYANTTTMLNGTTFRCWRPTNSPQIGDIGVYPNHIFIVENPATGMGVSALRTHVTEMVHYTTDANGRYHPNPALDRHRFQTEPLPEIIFFQYHCPDLKPAASRNETMRSL